MRVFSSGSLGGRWISGYGYPVMGLEPLTTPQCFLSLDGNDLMPVQVIWRFIHEVLIVCVLILDIT